MLPPLAATNEARVRKVNAGVVRLAAADHLAAEHGMERVIVDSTGFQDVHNLLVLDVALGASEEGNELGSDSGLVG